MAHNTSLVVGGTGFIGRRLVPALIARGDTVRVMSRRPATAGALPNSPFLHVSVADYGDVGALHDALDGVDTVFHLASSTQPKSSNDDMEGDIRSNLIPTVGLMNEVVRKGKARIVFVSSGGTVYGIPNQTPIAESHPLNPLCSYGIVKLAIEKYLHMFETLKGLDYRVLRVSNPFGPSQHLNPAQGVVGNFIHQLSVGRRLSVWGDGSIVRDFVYIDDVVSALMLAGRHSGEGRVFNISSGKGYRLIDVIEIIGSALGKRPEVDFAASRSFDIPVNVLDTGAAHRDLGWRPEITFEEGVRMTVESLQYEK
jgi:UDP-glucose 4-epimerase